MKNSRTADEKPRDRKRTQQAKQQTLARKRARTIKRQGATR